MKDAAVCKVGKECSSSYEAYSVSLSLVDEEGGAEYFTNFIADSLWCKGEGVLIGLQQVGIQWSTVKSN